MKRCKWCGEKNPRYIKYHDEEWGVLNLDEGYLLQMLILESFMAGLSWECILNKRADFEKAYDHFDIAKIMAYDDQKVQSLLNNAMIVRNEKKIRASINNAKIFRTIEEEYGSFKNYLLSYFDQYPLYELGKTTNAVSDKISHDLFKKGMRFVGSVTIYAYLQAIGLIVSHEPDCFKYHQM